MYQAILLSVHISLTEVNILHLDPSISVVLFQLFLFSFHGEPSLLLVSQGYLFMLKSYNLGSFNVLQKDEILYQYFIPELLEILHMFFLLLLFHKPSLLSFLPCFDLHLFSCFLNHTLSTIGLCYFFQMSQELLFLLVSSLLFKHLSIILSNVRENRRRYDNIKEKVKTLLFCLHIVDLSTIMGFFR